MNPIAQYLVSGFRELLPDVGAEGYRRLIWTLPPGAEALARLSGTSPAASHAGDGFTA